MARLHLLSLLLALTIPLLAPGAGAAAADDPIGVWPLQPTPDVVRRFDPPDSPYGSGHRGVDLAGHIGQQVHTALPGTVVFAGRIAGRGVVVVGHGDTRTTYEPVAASVAVGAEVARGAVIGTLELGGSHCFPAAWTRRTPTMRDPRRLAPGYTTCLHWGWIRNRDDVYLDPLWLVGAGPVRLLPLWQARQGRAEPSHSKTQRIPLNWVDQRDVDAT